jgi:adenylate cyclase
LAFLATAMRVDPGWTTFRHYLSGLAQFSMDRFAEAATSFEAMDPDSPDYWSTYDGLVLSVAAYGHLGRSADAANAMAKLKAYPTTTKDGTLSILRVQALFPFKNFADTERLQDGLRKAGMIELPFGLDPKSKDRLTGVELKKLTWGHETISKQLGTNLPSWSHTDAETGEIKVKIGDWSDSGPTWIEGDTMCFSLSAELRTCAVVYRNPAGSFEKKNEYLFYQPWQIFEFSVVN